MKRVFIIAEAGVNHNGSVDLAKRLIDVAVDAGVDAVKFQTFTSEKLVVTCAEKAEYQKKNTSCAESQYEMLKRLELSHSAHEDLISYCKKKGILFLSTPFDISDIEYLRQKRLPFMKIPSGAITDYPYLKKINECKVPVILSTGMSTVDEIEDALSILEDCSVSLLHCTTEYPCPFDAVNLKSIAFLKERFKCDVGYSDHTEGIEVAIAAVAMGATIIEKHFTLDRNMEGPDHKASIEPSKLKEMVACIRNVELSLGDGIKLPAPIELKNINIARKSIVAKRKIKKGEIFSEENLTVKRPGSGISPMQWCNVIGTAAIKEFKKDDLIVLS